MLRLQIAQVLKSPQGIHQIFNEVFKIIGRNGSNLHGKTNIGKYILNDFDSCISAGMFTFLTELYFTVNKLWLGIWKGTQQKLNSLQYI